MSLGGVTGTGGAPATGGTAGTGAGGAAAAGGSTANTPVLLASGLSCPWRIAVDASYVYWTNHDDKVM